MKLEGSAPPPHIRETWPGCWLGRVMGCSPSTQQMGDLSASTRRVETALGVTEAPPRWAWLEMKRRRSSPAWLLPSFQSQSGVCCGLKRWDHITEKCVCILRLFDDSSVQVWCPEQRPSLLAPFYFSVSWTPKIRTCCVSHSQFGFSVFCACKVLFLAGGQRLVFSFKFSISLSRALSCVGSLAVHGLQEIHAHSLVEVVCSLNILVRKRKLVIKNS